MFSFVSMPSSFFVNAGEANVHNRKKKHAGKSKYKWFLKERFSSWFTKSMRFSNSPTDSLKKSYIFFI